MRVLTCGILLLLGVAVNAQTKTNVNSCGDDTIVPDVIFVGGANIAICSESPCPVHPGSDAKLDIQFKSPRYLENIKPNILATSLGVSLNYPLFQDNACDGIVNTYCPLVQNEHIQYQYTMHLFDVFPEVTVGLKFEIIDKDTDTDVVCFNMDIVVVNDS